MAKRMTRKQAVVFFKHYFEDRDADLEAIDGDESLRLIVRDGAQAIMLLADGTDIYVKKEDATGAMCDFLREKSPYFLARNPPEELS